MAVSIWLIILPMFTAFALGIVKFFSKKLVKPVLMISSTIHLFLVVRVTLRALEEPIIYSLGSWDRFFAINLVIDPLAAVLILLITVISYLMIIYSLDFIKEDYPKYYLLLLLLIAGMIGMVAAGDLFNLYVFFEIVSLTSYVLVAFKKTDIAIEASFKYLILGTISGFFVLLGIIFIYQATGTLNLAQIAVRMPDVSLGFQIITLTTLIFGFGIKFALVPLHTWLPDAHPAAPAPISALLSGIVIKTSLYALLRVIYVLFGLNFMMNTNLISIMVIWGVFTFLLAHLMAYQQSNLKRLLAFSSIAQIGYITMAIALATEKGIIAGSFHIVSHALMKGALFLAAGVFIYSFKAYTIDDIKGLGFSLPLTSFGFTLAALAIIGLPPFNGFISKWLIIEATLEAGYLGAAFSLIVGSLLSLAYYLKVIRSLYSNGDSLKLKKKPNWKLEFSVLVLGLSCLLFGLLPQLPLALLEEVPAFLLDSADYINLLLGG
ncbi:complex I subunit 5 family protein [Fuchsiella alkaliacetigena]|uniref:complex I subunit 5 family protein n=1 Tax=Fuchsiella alkaliacetigena TaxID=957042 RepID=UPI00200B610E|nr:proton-conducting transporter membrane subunit [Fuchsiella alkaliacetigena]MCK8825926.1 proton-conducting membrane transporter [Fuchsiella alkaliacetigena]